MPGIVDSSDPVTHFIGPLSLKIERARGRDEPERVGVFLEHDLGARVDIGEIEQAEELVLGRGFVERQVRRAQDKPTLLPRLQIRRDLRTDRDACQTHVGAERTPGTHERGARV